MKKIKTTFRGVRYREHDKRKHGVQKDKYFFIRYKLNGRDREEGLGWQSEGWTAAKAYDHLRELKENSRIGQGPQSLAEKREIERQRKEAEKAALEQAEKENITFSYYFEKVYSPTSKLGKKDNTTRKETEHFNKWIKPVIGNMPFKEIKPFAIEKIKKNILAAKKAPRTLQYVFATIRQTWNMAKRDGLVAGDSPTKQVKVPKIDNKRIRFLNHAEADALLQTLQEKDRTTHDLTLLSLHTGLRMGEMAKLKWSHIDLDRSIISVMDPKGIAGRAAFMTDQVKSMFAVMKCQEPNDYVFTRRDGQPLSDMPRIFFEVVQNLDFNKGITDRRQKVVAHTLRHTFASWHIEAGTDLYTLKGLMGHSVIAMTERYSHLGQNALQNATKKLEQSIDRNKNDEHSVNSI